MRAKLSCVLVIAALSAPAAADNASPRGSVSVGANAGGHDHADDAGAQVGAGLEAELGLGMFTVGGALGYDSYALLDGVPVHSTSIAGRVGIAVPLAEDRTDRTIQVAAISSLELGVHHYSPEGERKEFLGGSTDYHGNEESSRFLGIRAGAAITIHPKNSTGFIWKLELVGRRDFRTVDLEYDRINCGGLFVNDNDCSAVSHGMTMVGGTELGVTTSIGIAFGT
jgi:hypothetical protein